VTVAPLTPDRYDAAVALWHEAGLTRPWNDPHDDLRRAVDGPASTVLGAVDDGRLVGTAMVGHDGHRGWVYYLAVATDRRRHGVGTALMRACEEWVVARGVPALMLMVRHGNEAAAGFYERLGYGRSEVNVYARRLD
jgi:hypothetical protein